MDWLLQKNTFSRAGMSRLAIFAKRLYIYLNIVCFKISLNPRPFNSLYNDTNSLFTTYSEALLYKSPGL